MMLRGVMDNNKQQKVGDTQITKNLIHVIYTVQQRAYYWVDKMGHGETAEARNIHGNRMLITKYQGKGPHGRRKHK
jgi:hypothetical protein